jgi:hypothetical protein
LAGDNTLYYRQIPVFTGVKVGSSDVTFARGMFHSPGISLGGTNLFPRGNWLYLPRVRFIGGRYYSLAVKITEKIKNTGRKYRNNNI